MNKINLDELKYNKTIFCQCKGKYITQMNIRRDINTRFIWLKYVMERQGGYANDFHVYSKEEITEGMEFRPRNDSIGDLFYIKLSRNEVIALLGEKAIEF